VSLRPARGRDNDHTFVLQAKAAQNCPIYAPIPSASSARTLNYRITPSEASGTPVAPCFGQAGPLQNGQSVRMPKRGTGI